MRVGITADIKDINKGIANVKCKVEQELVYRKLMPVAFEAIIRAMKDCDEDAFYMAKSG